MRVNTFDPKFLRCPRELSFGFWISILGIDAEDAVLVAVKCCWHAVYEYVVMQYPHIAQRGLGQDKAQLRQPPGGIVNKNQKRAIITASFKPVVGAAIYLDHFAKPGTTLTHRVSTHRSACSTAPVARPDHQLTGTLDGQLNIVPFRKLLVGQRRPKVSVVCADKLNSRGANGFIQPPIRGSTALLAGQSTQTFRQIALCQSPNLTGANTHPLRCLLLADLALFQKI